MNGKLAARHILLVALVLAAVLLVVYPPQFLDEAGQRVIVRRPLPGPEWFWRLFTAIELSKWK